MIKNRIEKIHYELDMYIVDNSEESKAKKEKYFKELDKLEEELAKFAIVRLI